MVASSPLQERKNLPSDTSAWDVEVFYDGECPLCRREIAMLRRWDRRERVRFTDLTGAGFDPASIGKTMAELMAEIHGRLPNGELIVGVEVFRRLYAAVGLGWLVWPTRLPGVSHLLAFAYKVFAARRLKWTGRCDANCSIPQQAVSSQTASEDHSTTSGNAQSPAPLNPAIAADTSRTLV